MELTSLSARTHSLSNVVALANVAGPTEYLDVLDSISSTLGVWKNVIVMKWVVRAALNALATVANEDFPPNSIWDSATAIGREPGRCG
jgi:hypothetical protein